jgi:hypothetical protein
MPHHFEPTAFYRTRDQVGKNKLFGSVPGRQAAIRRGELDPGFLVNGCRVNSGQQLNEYLEKVRGLRKVLPEGFGGAQPGAGRPRKQEDSHTD